VEEIAKLKFTDEERSLIHDAVSQYLEDYEGANPLPSNKSDFDDWAEFRSLCLGVMETVGLEEGPDWGEEEEDEDEPEGGRKVTAKIKKSR